MERLEELKQSLANMTPEQRLEKLREIREDRKVSKYATTVKAKRSQDKSSKLKDAFANMTPEERESFLEIINEGETD
jgi:ABC-type phosphate/phosphonate transport system substrate-binding protein|tara:strand:- start:487 stop:717 length:231 start_codon:yes stop_codon:yes gene_type:complete